MGADTEYLSFLSEFSVVSSQDVLFVLRFLGLTEEEIRNCVRIETKKRRFGFKKTKVEHRCTTNKMSEKYEGTSPYCLLAAYPFGGVSGWRPRYTGLCCV